MKRILLLMLTVASASVLVLPAMAQSIYTLRPQNAAGTFLTADTTLNADTSYLFAQLTPGYMLALQWTNTKVSGTVAGSVVVQGSDDATNWYTLTTDKTQSPYLTDTVTAINGNTTAMFVVKQCLFGYVRVRIITTGTQRSTMSGVIYYFTQPYKLR